LVHQESGTDSGILREMANLRAEIADQPHLVPLLNRKKIRIHFSEKNIRVIFIFAPLCADQSLISPQNGEIHREFTRKWSTF